MDLSTSARISDPKVIWALQVQAPRRKALRLRFGNRVVVLFTCFVLGGKFFEWMWFR